jgi:hypothetical protein
MKLTGYALIVVGLALALFTICYNLIEFNVRGPEQVGTVNPGSSSGTYWLALIPALIAAGLGVWLVLSRHKGYGETYDMTRQTS